MKVVLSLLLLSLVGCGSTYDEPKHIEKPVNTESGRAPTGGPFYWYAGAYQYTTQAQGTQAFLSQPLPFLNTSADYHTLGELAVETSDGLQIVEVGWTVDAVLNGDTNPHLFVYHWVNGNSTCYNGCGWVQVSTTRSPGMTLTVTTTAQEFDIQHKSDGNWWVGYQGEWIGYFPDSLWSGSFTSAGLVQWFGEVASGTNPLTTPTTEMGNGQFSSQSTAAFMSPVKIYNSSGSLVKASLTMTTPTDSSLYNDTNTSNNKTASFRYGGPGH